MRWTRQRRRAEAIAGRVSRERSSGTQTNDAGRGRRSRVVLTPRRWCQVLREAAAQPGLDASLIRKATVARKPGHRGDTRARRKPLKPLRREGRIASAEPVCSCAFCYVHLHARPRVQRAPGFPCALCLKEGQGSCATRASRAAGSKNHVCERSNSMRRGMTAVCGARLENRIVEMHCVATRNALILGGMTQIVRD
jgi:hypothetical protein